MRLKIVAVFLVFLVPRLYGQGEFYENLVKITEFVASEYFAELKKDHTDPELVDTIYVRALDYSGGDISETLLMLTFALLADKDLPLSIPVIKERLNIPLPSAAEPAFSQKVKNLPKNLFFDSKGSFGDKDKLAHFFGSAFLAYHLGFTNIPEMAGIAIEYFETAFKVYGALDFKDITVNYLGNYYGELLANEEFLMPSDIIKVYSLLYLRL